MSNNLLYPKINPLRFFLESPSTLYHSRDFDDFEFTETLPYWHSRIQYYQPWEKGDLIKLFMYADFGPHTVNILNEDGDLVSSVQFQQMQPNAANPGMHLYRLDIDLSALEGVYYFQRVSGSDEPLICRSGPQQILNKHKRTILLDYQHSRYHEGVFWKDVNGASFYYPSLRVEGSVVAKFPTSEGTDFENQSHSLEKLDETAYNVYGLTVADSKGIPFSMADIVNRIFTCDDVKIDGKGFVKPAGNKWDMQEEEGYFPKGMKAEIRLANNRPVMIYQNNAPVNARFGMTATADSKGFGLDTGGTTYEITDVI